MGDKDLEVLWTVCSNLETLLLSEPRGDFPEHFYVNLREAFKILRNSYRDTANTLMGEEVIDNTIVGNVRGRVTSTPEGE